MWYNKNVRKRGNNYERNNFFRTNDNNQCNFIDYPLTMYY